MSLDPYQPCPCGSGKKVKFCCVKDLTHDVDKILRLIEAEQRMAALEHTQRLIDAKGPREALLVLKATVELQLGEMDKAAETVEQLTAAYPKNPNGYALQAVVRVTRGNTREAIASLQQCIEASTESWSEILVDGIDIVAQSLLAMGDILAARGHLLLLGDVGSEELAERALRGLMRISMSPEVPLLLKQELSFDDAPDDAPWREAFEDAMQQASFGEWRQAVEALETLAGRYPETPTILKCLAHVRGWLGDGEATADAWRKYAAVESLPLEERVEARAMALLVSPLDGELIDQCHLTFPVRDASALLELLVSNRRLAQVNFDPEAMRSEDEPPPKALFVLLDRDRPDSGESPTVDEMPQVLATLALFGRQTDREARLEAWEFTAPRLEEVRSLVGELLGDLVGGEPQQETVGSIPEAATHQTRLWLPPDTPRPRRVEVEQEFRRRDYQQRWPDRKQPSLDDKTPREAAQDPVHRLTVLAEILLLELSSDSSTMYAGQFDFNQLRQELNLPTLGPIAASDVGDIRKLPLTRLARLDYSGLSDDDLIFLYHRASRTSATAALRKICLEIVGRDSLDDNEQVNKEAVYRTLAALWMHDPEKSVQFLEEGKRRAIRHGHSPAEFLLADLQIAVGQGDMARFERNLQELQVRHLNEPGIREQLISILMRLGLLRPDGSMRAPRSPAPEPAAAAPGGESKIWTPDSGGAAAPSGEKSKLWVPGMD